MDINKTTPAIHTVHDVGGRGEKDTSSRRTYRVKKGEKRSRWERGERENGKGVRQHSSSSSRDPPTLKWFATK